MIGRSVSAPSKGQRVGEPRVRARLAELRVRTVRSPAVGIFLWSRAAIWAGALFAWLVFEPNRHPNAARWDDPTLTRDLGWVTDVWARWDSVWFLRIAEHGYGATSGVAAAFYPLYPLTLAGVGRAFGGHYVLAGIVDLARLRARGVRPPVPARGGPPRRRGRAPLRPLPGGVPDGALPRRGLQRVPLPPARDCGIPARRTGALARRRPRHGARDPDADRRRRAAPRAGGDGLAPPDRWRALASLCVAPLVFSAYPLYLGIERGDAFAFARSQGFWNRHVSPAGPLGGIWDGLRAGWAGIEQLVSGSHTHVYWTPVRDTDPMRAAAVNLECLAFLALFVALTVIAWRRFGAPYGLFCAVSLAIPLSVPSHRWPLLSMPRFGLVLFPCFLALAVLGGRPRVHTAILVVSSIMLGVAVTQWALWQWVA